MTEFAAIHGARGGHWVAHLARHAHARPGTIAVRCGETARTWHRLAERVLEFSRALAHLGIGAGDRVAFVMGNGVEYVESLLAVSAAGAIGVPVNPRLTAAETASSSATAAPPGARRRRCERLAADAAADRSIRV